MALQRHTAELETDIAHTQSVEVSLRMARHLNAFTLHPRSRSEHPSQLGRNQNK